MSDAAVTMDLAAEAAWVSLDIEPITYTPIGGAGLARSALVRRLVPQEISGLGRAPEAMVTLRNHAAAGRLSSNVDTGGDRISWSPKRGAAAKVSRVLEIVSANGGFVTVLVG
jgi:hypothetical protein